MFRVVIPARFGSSRLPGKPLQLLAGKPLLQYAVESARLSSRLTRLILTTDDNKIAALGRRLGVEVPFRRPARLAAHDTPMIETVRHAVLRVEAMGQPVDLVCLLQPTAPLRTAAYIDGCIELLELSGFDAVMTVVPIPAEFHPDWAYRRQPDGTMRLWNGALEPISRRQDLVSAYCRSGDVYVTRRDVIVEGRSLYGQSTGGFPIDAAATININEPEDWERAEMMLRRRHLPPDTASSNLTPH